MKLLALLLACLTATHAADLRVLTYNIRYATSGDKGERNWSHRKDSVVNVIRKNRPDVLGVQEALATQMDHLAKALPDYAWVGVGRDDGKRRGEFSAIFFRKDRFEATDDDQGTFWLSDTPDVAGSKSFGNKVIRICTWVHLRDSATKGAFYVFNTHWDHRHQGSREESGKLVKARIAARSDQSAPVVLMGDFNATETNPAVSILLGKNKADGGFRESFLHLHPGENNRRTTSQWTGSREGKGTIDHVLVSPGWVVKKSWIDRTTFGKTWPSDHYPVGAVLGMPPTR